jgi:hypothetical protein
VPVSVCARRTHTSSSNPTLMPIFCRRSIPDRRILPSTDRSVAESHGGAMLVCVHVPVRGARSHHVTLRSVNSRTHRSSDCSSKRTAFSYMFMICPVSQSPLSRELFVWTWFMTVLSIDACVLVGGVLASDRVVATCTTGMLCTWRCGQVVPSVTQQ